MKNTKQFNLFTLPYLTLTRALGSDCARGRQSPPALDQQSFKADACRGLRTKPGTMIRSTSILNQSTT